MKRLFPIICLFLLCFTTTAVFAAKDEPDDENKSPTVISPKSGESWKTGTTRVIKWSKGSGFNFVKIQLLKSGKHALWVSKKTKNDGKYPWKIPSTIATSSAYKFKITATTNSKFTDTSNKNFTITKTSGGGAGTLSVTQPNGGQKWKTGKKYALKWNKGNAGAYVKIQLLKSGKHYKWITKKTKNDGKYPWKVLSTVATGSAYKVKITSRTKKTVTDTSNANFTITNASSGGDSTLEMISPNGGESWKKGDVVSIEWEKGTVSSDVRLFLYKSGKRYKTIAAATANDGLRRWSIPNNLATSSAYKVRVQSKINAKQYDDSDSSFTITSSAGSSLLKVLTPNGDESWEEGTLQKIEWDSGNAGDHVKIELLKSDSFYSTISAKTPNDGSYEFTLPYNWETPQSDYKIKITSTTDSSESDATDGNFTITKFIDLKITSPNSSDNWKMGETHLIEWIAYSPERIKRVNIYLYKNGKSVGQIQDWVAAESERYKWDSGCNSSGFCWTKKFIEGGNDFQIVLKPVQGTPLGEGEAYSEKFRVTEGTW